MFTNVVECSVREKKSNKFDFFSSLDILYQRMPRSNNILQQKKSGAAADYEHVHIRKQQKVRRLDVINVLVYHLLTFQNIFLFSKNVHECSPKMFASIPAFTIEIKSSFFLLKEIKLCILLSIVKLCFNLTRICGMVFDGKNSKMSTNQILLHKVI